MVSDLNSFTLFKREGSPYWYYYVYRSGKKTWRSTGEKVKTKALAVVFERMTSGDILKEYVAPEEIRFDEFAKDFWNYDTSRYIQERLKRGKKFSREQAMKYQSRLDKYIMPTFGSKSLMSITRNAINDWFVDLPSKYNLSNKTSNEILSEFKILLDYAVYDEILTKNTAREVKQFAPKAVKRGCYTETEVRALFSVPWSNVYAYTASRLAETTGLRLGEILALKRKSICCRENLDGSSTYFLHIAESYTLKEGFKCTKSGKVRDIKIHPTIRDMLLALPSAQRSNDPNTLLFTMNGVTPMSKKTILTHLRIALDKAGIDWKGENLTFHSFRHFANSHYLPVLGGELTRLLIGHESEAMTKNYLHDTDEDYRQIISLQERLLSI